VTVLEGIQKSTEFLARKDVEAPRLQAELLLAHLLKLPRMKLYLNFERVLSRSEVEELRACVQRRGRREPVQHILGSTSFCGLEIIVNPHVLVPRPETEVLAEAGWTFLAARGSQPSACLDFGTGSGCLAIALASRCPATTVHALDVSPQAIAVARQNAAAHGLTGRIQFHTGDGLGALPSRLRFDLIVANPPYIPTAEIDSLQPEVRDHDPRCALDGGPDGLDFYRRLAAQAPAFLAPQGRFMMELGDGQSPAVCRILQDQNWIVEAVREDYTQHPRVAIARSSI
jgi:release factor glutamine methyltransferase